MPSVLKRFRSRQPMRTYVGRGRRLGQPKWRAWRIAVPDGLPNRHTLVVGSSGVGKTRLLYDLLCQALADPKQGVILIEPHGDLYETVVRHLAHRAFGPKGNPSLAERVALIDPTDQARGSVGLNILETEPNQLPYEVVAELITAFHAIWRESWGARMEDIIRQSCLALNELGLTLAELPRLLMDEAFRAFIASQLKNESVKMYFEQHFSGLSRSDQREWIESTRNKVSAFVSTPFLEPILACERSTIRFGELMQEGKIVLVKLSRSRLKTESRRLFGMLLFAKILIATLGRDSIPESERTPVTIFVDEMHELFNADLFLPVLEGGRKYKVSFGGLFHQSLSQLKPEEVDIVIGNAATLVAFQLGRKDAERMAKEFFRFTGLRVKYEERDLLGRKDEPEFFNVQEELEHAISELMHQGVRECYVKFKTGDANDLYIAKTPDVQYPPPHPEWEQRLVELSASKYNRPLALIEQERKARMERLDALMQAANAEASGKASKPIRTRRART